MIGNFNPTGWHHETELRYVHDSILLSLRIIAVIKTFVVIFVVVVVVVAAAAIFAITLSYALMDGEITMLRNYYYHYPYTEWSWVEKSIKRVALGTNYTQEEINSKITENN